MKFTLAWLKEHLETVAPLDEIVDRLIRLGLEVEAVTDRAAPLRPFVVARVLSAEPHPNADKLRVCVVDAGAGPVQVVCGAPNARAGMKGVFAAAGTTIPGTGLLLKATTIRGVASNGMLCSEREMGLSEEHQGIIELPDDAPVGQPFAGVLGLDDPTIEIKLTPNRGDCLGVRGIARDLAAAGLGRLKPLDLAPVPGRFKSPLGVRRDFTPATAAACPLFVGRYLRGVRNGPSPRWLQQRLKAIGLRPISALVDITNFITFDLGRPLHVFDADTVAGGIVARLSRPGEKLLALDGREYMLDDTVCVIADDDGPLGLGGVMGGEASGCTAETANVFVEAALFDPLRTAATGRKLGIMSDARYRFERGVDPAFVRPGMEIASRMILDLCGGEPSEVVVAGAEPAWQRTLKLRPERVHGLGGLDLPEAETTRLLEALGFGVTQAGAALAVSVPSWRPDVEGEADLVEEVTRLHGYDAIPPMPLPPLTAVPRPAIDARQRRSPAARQALAARGLDEAVTYSFVGRGLATLFGGGQPELALANPISADLDAMRPSLLPGLAAAAKRNSDRGFADFGLFEVGPQYAGDAPQGQSAAAAALRRGMSGPRHWAERPRPVDAFDAKGDALAVLAACGIAVDQLMTVAEAPAWYHPGRAGTLRLGPKLVLAAFGELHPAVLAAMELRAPVVGCEIFLDRLLPPRVKGGKTRTPLVLSDLPAVERDFAFVVDRDIAADAIVRAARGAERALIAEVSVFDLFEGAALGEGKKSVAIAVRLEPRERTLTDAEIEAVGRKIVAAVAKATGGVLRA